MDGDYGICEIAECGRDAQHSVQVEKDGLAFGPPLALCDDHVVPYLICGHESCSEGATEVLWCVREDPDTGEDVDRRALFACARHALEMRTRGEVTIDGRPYELEG